MADKESKPKKPEIEKEVEKPVEPAAEVKPAELIVEPPKNLDTQGVSSGNINGEPVATPVTPAQLITPEPISNPIGPMVPGEGLPKSDTSPNKPFGGRGGFRPGSGRKPGIKNKPKEPAPPSFEDLQPQPELVTAPPVDYTLLAGSMFDMGTGTLTMIFGPEWKPQSDAERQAVIDPLKHYLQVKQVQDIPPGVMLTIVLLAYSAPRLNGPNTRPKIAKLMGKVKLGWFWLKSKFSRRKFAPPNLSIVNPGIPGPTPATPTNANAN